MRFLSCSAFQISLSEGWLSDCYRCAVWGSHTLFACADFPSTIMRVDPISGDRTIVSNAFICTGPLFDNADSLAVEANGSLVINSGNRRETLIRVDPVTGDRTEITAGSVRGSGPVFNSSSTSPLSLEGLCGIERESGTIPGGLAQR